MSVAPFVAAVCSALLAFASVVRKKPTFATWCFFVGMLLLAAESAITGLILGLDSPADILWWTGVGFIVRSVIPVVWLAFSLTYSRGNRAESLRQWRLPLILLAVVPVVTVGLQRAGMLGIDVETIGANAFLRVSGTAQAITAVSLVGFVLVLMNVEQTVRSAVGTTRWRLKFVVLGLGTIFGARIYVQAQSLAYSAVEASLWTVASGGLLIGCAFLLVAYARDGFSDIEVYPSAAVLRSSVTIILVGGYLFVVGILAQLVRWFGGADSFQLQAFVVLLGMSGLALLLLSDRAKQRVRLLTARHFQKAQHDSLQLWRSLSGRLANVRNEHELSQAAVKCISDTFNTLAVRAWLIESQTGQLETAASTAPHVPAADHGDLGAPSHDFSVALEPRHQPFDLEEVGESWAAYLRKLNPTTFADGGHRWAVPLRAGEQVLGVVVLADRVDGVPYTVEELDLLKCIADQMTSVLLNLRMGAQLAAAKESEALRTMSAFFVHDLKNAASSLNLMLKNLPVHFDDPAFRADALRAVGNTTHRIQEMIARLASFKEAPALACVPTDLNDAVRGAVAGAPAPDTVQLCVDLQALPTVELDREQIKSVVSNLLINAYEACPPQGKVRVSTEQRGRQVLLLVADNGQGMTPDFINQRLFRPFQSTKKNGLGIGLFQCRAIVQAHGGSIQATSEPGKGTTFTVSLPAGSTR